MKAHNDECGGASEGERDDFVAGDRPRREREKEAPQRAVSAPGSEENVDMENAERSRASPSAAASEAGASKPSRKRESHFSENEDVKIKDPQGTKRAVEDVTRLPNALANVGQDDDQRVDANIPISIVPGDVVDGMEQKNSIQRCGTHTIAHECVTRSRDAEELTREDTTSLVMLATEFAAVETVDTHSSTQRFRSVENWNCLKSLAWL